MKQHVSLFDNLKLCAVCQRPLPVDYGEEMCPACQENALFNEVREYIRSKDVTEYQVADHFKIPHRQVKKWITEGRIEYKERTEHQIANLRCCLCGEPITFGNLCQKCYKQKYNTRAGYAPLKEKNEDDRMRFFDDN